MCYFHYERETAKGIKVQNQKSMKTFGEKNNYNYLRYIGTDSIKEAEM